MPTPQKLFASGFKDVLKGFACGSVLFGVPVVILATIVPIVFGQDVTFRAHQTSMTIALWEGKTYKVETSPSKPPEFHPISITWIKLGNVPPLVPPPVDPPDPPTPATKVSQVIVVRESADATPATARLIVGLRRGPSFDYLKSKNITALILDDDATDASLLFKDWLFFLGFGVLSLITGFALPSLELYEAMSQALTKRIINPNWYVVALVLAVAINFAIVRTTLLSKYAVRRQATGATLVFFPVLILLTFLYGSITF